jgi:anti-anti-sigma factor
MTLLKAELVDLDGCSVRWVGRHAVVTVPAEIDLNNADLVGHHLLQVLDDHPLGLVADMMTTEYCGCAGIHALSRVRAQAAGTGIVLGLAAGAPMVRRVLELTGLSQLIGLHRDVQTALDAMPTHADGRTCQPASSDGGLALGSSRKRGWHMLDDKRSLEPDVLERLDGVTAALKGLREVLGREEELGRALQRSVDQITHAVPMAAMASVTVLRGHGAAETVACSSARVWAIDSDQYAAGEGPCLEAARTGEIVRVSVEEARERWPQFARSAQQAGVESYLSAPLMLDDGFAGSLNLYSELPHGFGELDEAFLGLYVAATAAALANARRYTEVRSLADQLGQALESREVIGQAVGVLMATQRISADEAFGVLSRQSQNSNTKLREIAAAIVADARRPAGHDQVTR